MGEPTITDKFYSLFNGNRSFYVKHQPPFNMDETTGKVKGKWVGIAKDRSSGEILSVSRDKYKEHLEGGDGIAVEPLREDNTCFFATIDIDVIGVNYTSLIVKLYQHGFKFAPFVSKSGALHIYFFFQDPEKGSAVIETVKRLVDVFGLGRLYTSDKGKSKVEIFPKHAVLPPDSQGSCVFLPYYNAADNAACKQKMISPTGTLLSITSAIKACESYFTSLKEMNAVLDSLPWSDAPYCVQMLALTGALGDGDGRNDFIFTAGVYLKKKLKDNFFEPLMEINNALVEPESEADVRATYKSVIEKDFQYKCKSGPCAEYCDTKLCKKREYGVGKDKGNHFTGFECWGEISRVMAEEPYYIWKVQVNPGEEFRELKVDSEADLMNQMIVARLCVRDLNQAPLPVSQWDWVAIVNQSLAGIKDRQIMIEASTDTSEMGALKQYFTKFITQKQMNCQLPYLILLNQVYFNDGFYYFTTDGFKEYLRVSKFVLGRTNLRENLIRYGCIGAEISYKSPGGIDRKIECWKKEKDEELDTMAVFYEDVLQIETSVVSSNPLNKVNEDEIGGHDGEDERLF